MAIITSRADLSQGASTTESVAFTSSAGIGTTLTGTGLPVVAANDFFEIRNSPITGNNGLYIATGTPSTSSVSCDKVSGADPTDDASETVGWLGDTTTYKSVFVDTAALGLYLIEQGNLSVDGVTGQAAYSFYMQEFKDDNFLIANAPFPMLTIDSDAGKYIVGQDISGNNNGFNWIDDSTHAVNIRTRQLLRNAGWDEVDSAGNTIARYVGVVTLGAFEDASTDTAYYQFGDDTTVDDTVDFAFAGPVNEAVKFYEEQAQTDLAITTTTITRVGGSFITEGYKVGGQVTIRDAEDAGNNGTFVLTAVSATVLTTTSLTANADDTAAILAVDNDNAMTLRLRVRDGDAKGKTFAQGDLASAGKSILGNFVYSFPLANGADQKIDVSDLGIDANSDGIPDVSPYSGMSITYHSSPQARTDLVGGSVNFGIIVEGNNGTDQEVFEFLQWSLRSTGGNGSGDIDAGGEVAIGRSMDGLARFVGDTGEFGTPDGLSFPNNPDGGGSGVYIDSLNALSKNNVIFYDNLNAPKTFPETIAVTLDFNQIAIDDTTTEFDLFYDRTIRTSVSDLVVNSAGTITSAGTNLPNNAEIVTGKYIRISGFTGADVTMNGVYQLGASLSTASWDVARYDGLALITTSATLCDADQYPVDTPDAKLVHTNLAVTASTISFADDNPDTINDSGSGFGFTAGDVIEVEGSTSNDGVYLVNTAAAGVLTLDSAEELAVESAGASITITKVVSGLADADEVFSYDFDGNVQGGRVVSTTTFVQAKAIGSTGAQFVQSSVQAIVSGTPLTIPVSSATERNYV